MNRCRDSLVEVRAYLSGNGIRRTLSDSIPDQPKGLLDVLHLDPFRKPHPRVSFRKTDHALELSCRRRDPPLLRPNVLSDFTHLDV